MKAPPSLFLSLFLFLLSNLSEAADVTNTASSITSYALVSPTVGTKFKASGATHAAEQIIAWAGDDLTKSPNPLAHIHTEGTLPHEGIRDASLIAEKDWAIILNLAVAWKVTGDSRYLQACEKYLDAWLSVYQPDFNPIDETHLDQIFFAYDLTQTDLSQAIRNKMNLFLHDIANRYIESAEKTHDDANWQSHRIKLATLAAYALGDISLIDRARNAFRKQILLNIKPDGSVVDFYKRDALHYVVYDLEPLTVAALAAKSHGEDWFHPSSHDDQAVETAIDWLTPYALGQKTHEEFVHSKVTFDAKRAKIGLKGYSGVWDPSASSKLYQWAVMADSKYLPVSHQIISISGHQPDDWLEILSEAIR